ncbi:serine hydrolase domain-containing protein [Chitinophaga ginsengisoli]|uniref:CubicO group peptidase (Beta-lactamase class C family) n=1 Tax=Chitinophaga ginsengisoli TaxID=363837 RepID=A0A2P8GLN7_9BACT|nr:serine hydrolase domain-containing protein [Chitinophaga ginsengisoli]PSL34870.1 CubicO group peptidase (beta-lactamase class C family) [Chitinophaga ginsengisoli]
MTRRILFLIAFLSAFSSSFAQQKNLSRKLDSLLTANTKTPFNGVVVVSRGGKTLYSKAAGYASFENKQPVNWDSEFIIGSISKQITAVIVLQEMEKGHLQLNDPIHKYLPDLPEKWADTVTIHHLLTHTHGITALDKPLAFTPGSRFAYGFISYDLLSQIVEKTSDRTFPDLCMALFKQCGMQHSFHPRTKQYKDLAQGYTLDKEGQPQKEESILDVFAAAGGLISSGDDLVRWNNSLHGGKLLSDKTYRLMIAPKENAFREHLTFGTIDYGYGITTPRHTTVPELAMTGVAPGFISMDVYFPGSKTSVIVLENIARNMTNLKQSFYYHEQVLEIVKAIQ